MYLILILWRGMIWMKTEDIESNCEKVPESGCWLWTRSIKPNGYGQAHYNGKVAYAHRMSYEQEYGEIPDGMCVLHTCDVRSCCNPRHLFLGTAKDNCDDKMAKGRYKQGRVLRGSEVYRSKLTEEVVVIMKQLRAHGMIGKDIRSFLSLDVSVKCINCAIVGSTWSHVPA